MDNRRIRRINGVVKKALGEILLEGKLKNSFHGLITITDVRISADLSVGNINYTVLGNSEESAQSYLDKSRYEITSQLSKKVRLRILPRLQFHIDETQKRADRIEELIREIRQGSEGS